MGGKRGKGKMAVVFECWPSFSKEEKSSGEKKEESSHL